MKTEDNKMANFMRYMAMPYHQAAKTMILYASEQGWSGVNDLYQNLPTSTEQMMHVEKLISKEPFLSYFTSPEWIEGVFPDWKYVFSDELGESGILSLIADASSSPYQATKYADGWNGDRFLVFQNTKKPSDPFLLIGRSDWDTIEDANDFAMGWDLYLAKHVKDTKSYFVSKKEKTVVYGIGTNSEKVQNAAWATFQIEVK